MHANGGRIFAQLWHGGRVSSLTLLGGAAPLSPSGVNDDLEQLQVWAQLQNGYYTKIHATPSRAMTTDEVVAAVDEFRQAATRAMAAGFDGVEIHAANGYLPHQFLSSTLNRRDDRYGGSVANRARFAEIVDAVGGRDAARPRRRADLAVREATTCAMPIRMRRSRTSAGCSTTRVSPTCTRPTPTAGAG